MKRESPIPSLEDQLRAAINDCEWSLNSIANESGIAQPVLHRFAKGERSVSMATADKIARYFQMRFTKPKSIDQEAPEG